MSRGIPQTRPTTTSGQNWKDAKSGMVIDDLDMGAEYTFEVRGLGETRAGVGDLHGASASTH